MTSEAELIRGNSIHLVEASAGTGKTTWMVRAATQLILGDRRAVPRVQNPERLLAVTFTNAATAELKERLRSALLRAQAIAAGAAPTEQERWLADACAHARDAATIDAVARSLDRLTVTTIHGFCKGVLEEFPFECGVAPGLTFIEQADAYLDEAVADEWRHRRWDGNRLGAIASPGELGKQARRVRGAIGAVRPSREELAARIAEGEVALRAPLDALRDAFDQARLERLVAQTQWNAKQVRSAADVATLAAAIAQYQATGHWEGDLANWTSAAIAKAANGTKKHAAGRAQMLAEPILPLVDAAEPLLATRELLLSQDAVLAVVERTERAMTAARVAAFVDMVALVERAVRDPVNGPRLRRALADRYDVVLVDEFQDTDWAQWRIFASLFESKPLVMVGDPKQSIYKFRGADITAYHEARAARVHEHTLRTNYRSDAGLVRAVHALFTGHSRPFAVPRERLDFPTVDAERKSAALADSAARPLTFLDAGAGNADDIERRGIRATADEIARLLSDARISVRPTERAAPRAVQPSDIAVLVAENRQAGLVVRALRGRGIAAVASATGDITASAAWEDVRAVVEAIHDHADGRVVRRALISALGGWSAEELRAPTRDTDTWRRTLERLAEARRDWSALGATQALLRLFRDWHAVERAAALGDGERRLTDLRQVIGLLQVAEREGAHGPGALLDWMRRFAAESDEKAEVRQLQLESDADAVQVSTVHGAKGLEYGIVFCPFLWKGKSDRVELPRVERDRDGTRRVVFTEPDHEIDDPEANGDSEQLRLAYVALTRAKWRTYCVIGQRAGRAQWTDGPILHLLSEKDGGANQLASEHPELVEVGLVDAHDAPAPVVAPQSAAPLRAVVRVLAAQQRTSWGVTSYTGLTRRLKGTELAELAPRLDDVESAPESALDDDGLPGGAQTGDALHEMLEVLDYQAIEDRPALDALIASTLDRYAIPGPHAGAVERAAAQDVARRMLLGALTTPFDTGASPLSTLPRHAGFREWRFHLSVATLSPQTVAAVFRTHGASWLADSYARSLEVAPSGALEGFLTGVVDLMALHDGRWWIVDWKTNTLGRAREHYAAPALRRAMQQHHFVLQYHLYVLALHRFLRARLGARYDYERDVGGVGYAFLRGLASDVPSWFTDRPSLALVQALDDALAGAAS